MTSSRAIPSTRLGSAYRALLVVAGVCSIVGIADAVRALFWLTLEGAMVGSGAPGMQVLTIGLRLVAWSLVALAAYTGWRRNAVPSTWILVCIPILGWAVLLAHRYI